MRLIDADAFEANMQNEWERNEISNGEWIHFREMINAEPTIDAVEVVRCKKCKHYMPTTPYALCEALDCMATNSNNFCSFGERRTDD